MPPQFRLKRLANGVVETQMLSVDVTRTFNRFARKAHVTIVDVDGSRHESYPEFEPLRIEARPDAASEWATLLGGFVAAAKQAGGTLTLDMLSHDNWLRRRDVGVNPDQHLLDLGFLPVQAANGVRSVAWSPTDEFVAAVHPASPFVRVWQREPPEGTTFTLLNNPATLPAGEGLGVAWSPVTEDGVFLAVAHVGSPYLTVYELDGTTLTKLDDPSDLPGATGSNGAGRVAWSPDGQFLCIAHKDVNGLGHRATVYQRTGTTLERVDPGGDFFVGSSTNQPTRVGWDRNGRFLAMGHTQGDRLAVWERKGTTFERIAAPNPAPTNSVSGVAWAPDADLLLAVDTGGFVHVYRRDGTSLGRVHSMESGRTSLTGCAWDPLGAYAAVGTTDGGAVPKVLVYQRVGDTLTPAWEADLWGDNEWVESIAWSPDGQFLVAGENVAARVRVTRVGRHIEDILQFLIEELTPLTWDANLVSVTSNKFLRRRWRGERLTAVLDELASISDGDEYGATDDMEFFWRPQGEAGAAPTDLTTDEHLDHEAEFDEDATPLVNRVVVHYGEADQARRVILDDVGSQAALQAKFDAPRPVVLEIIRAYPEIRRLEDAERKATQLYEERASIQRGRAYSWGRLDHEPGMTVHVVSPINGVDAEFRIASLRHVWPPKGRESTIVGLAENQEGVVDILVAMGQELARFDARGAVADAPVAKTITIGA